MASSYSTIVQIQNKLSTEIELQDTETHNWSGEIVGTKPWAVQPGKEIDFQHAGASSSSAAVVFRARNEAGETWDWVVAWENQGTSSLKVYSEIIPLNYNPTKWIWDAIKDNLSEKNNNLPVQAHGLRAVLSIGATEGSATSATVTATISYATDASADITVQVTNKLSKEIELQTYHNWEGQLVTTDLKWAIQPGVTQDYPHEGAERSSAALVFRASNAAGQVWDWVVAWTGVSDPKVYTEIVAVNYNQWDWDDIEAKLSASNNGLPVQANGLQAVLTLTPSTQNTNSATVTATISYAST